MVDDNPEDTAPSPDSGRAKRAPPTIDLEASEVSSETRNAGGDAQPERISREPSAAISPWVIAPVSGAVAASLVICVGWILGWPAVPATPAPPQVSAAVIDDLAARVASIESRISKPAAAAPDPAVSGRIETLEKSMASLRGELASLRAQSEKLATALNDVKSTPREGAAAVDLSAINERIAQIERATRAQGTEIAQEGAKPVDDVPLRRIVAAALLDVLVRIGDPYPAALAAAKALADDPDALQPLDGFAASGVPTANTLSPHTLTLRPKLSPPPQQTSTNTPT